MTDDLVKRLRDFEQWMRDPEDQKFTLSSNLFDQAADRIEALMMALREIEMLHYDSEKNFYHDAMKSHHIAVAALGEKKDG